MSIRLCVEDNHLDFSLPSFLLAGLKLLSTRAAQLCLMGMLVTLMHGFGITGVVCGQTLVVTSDNVAVTNSTGVLHIDNGPQMPQLSLEVTGACGTVSYTVSVEWISSSFVTMGSLSGEFSTEEILDVDWSQLDSFEGGTATITWSVTAPNGTAAGNGTFTFNIVGDNPNPSDVYRLLAYPWFFANSLAWESRTWTLAPNGYYHQFRPAAGFANSGYPLECNCPGGFGIGQLEFTFGGLSDDDLWNWLGNVLDSILGVLSQKNPRAYNFWESQVTQWRSDPAMGNNPVPESKYTYCDFQYPITTGNYYGDAEWMKAYNGGYFIWWKNSTPGTANGSWGIGDTTGLQPGYVPGVCSSNAPTAP